MTKLSQQNDLLQIVQIETEENAEITFSATQ